MATCARSTPQGSTLRSSKNGMCDAVSSPSRCVTTVAKLNSSMKSWSWAKSSTANAFGTYIFAHCYTGQVTVARLLLAAFMLAGLSAAQEHISFTTRDGWIIHADMYGAGDRGVVLVHGGRFEKGSWEKQAQA